MVDGGVPFAMLSDSGGRVGKVYGVYDEDAGVETRRRFIIDPDGIVQGYVHSTISGQAFQSKPTTDSRGSRPSIPRDPGHLFH